MEITEAANQLADEQIAAYSAKIKVFRSLCTLFNRVAKEFPAGPERDFAQHFSNNFLDFWKQALSNSQSTSVSTYS
ncbi:MAG: hypothetical protein ACRERD_24335, partial [Candidatus Binatia bacterium]